jgi:hypothetical protein
MMANKMTKPVVTAGSRRRGCRSGFRSMKGDDEQKDDEKARQNERADKLQMRRGKVSATREAKGHRSQDGACKAVSRGLARGSRGAGELG